MKQPILFVALLLALAVTGLAQNKPAPPCTTRVLVLKHNWEDHGKLERQILSKNQSDWWKDNAKKFPGVCLVTEDPADYVLAWTETWTTVNYVASVPVTSTSSGTVTTSDGQTATYSGTTTTNQPQQQQWNHWWVNARLYKVDAGKLTFPEAFEAKHHGRWLWSKPDKDAFERSMKQLSKLTKQGK